MADKIDKALTQSPRGSVELPSQEEIQETVTNSLFSFQTQSITLSYFHFEARPPRSLSAVFECPGLLQNSLGWTSQFRLCGRVSLMHLTRIDDLPMLKSWNPRRKCASSLTRQ